MELFDYLGAEQRQAVRSLLVWIGALHPATLKAGEKCCYYNLRSVIEEVRTLLPTIEQLAEEKNIRGAVLEDAADTIDDLLATIDAIQDHEALKRELVPNLKGRKLMRGAIGDFPLFSLLPYQAVDPAWQRQFRHYKALILLLSAALRGLAMNIQRDFSAAIASASNALRLLSDNPILTKLPSPDESLETLRDEWESIRDGQSLTLTPTQKGYARAIAALLRFYLDKVGGRSRRNRSLPITTESGAGERLEGIAVRWVRPMGRDADELAEAKKTGLARAELAEDVEYITVNDDLEDETPEYPVLSLARQVLARQRQLDVLEKSAQMLPTTVGRLAPWEIAVFLRTMKEAWIESLGSSASKVRTEAVAALMVVFWLSRKLSDALQLMLYASEQYLPSRLPRSFLGYLIDTQQWVLPAIRPKGEPTYKEVNKDAAVPVSDRLYLPDNVDNAIWLKRLDGWQRARRSNSAAAFSCAGPLLEEECGVLLSRSAELTQKRVTLARLEDTMFLRILDRCGDKATAILTLARPHRLGDTQLHYTTISSERLRRLYADSCREVASQAVEELSEFGKDAVAPAALAHPIETLGEFVGCPIRPAEPSMQRLARSLASAVEASRRALLSASDFVEFSNTFTCYVVAMYLHLTGIRAVKNPLPSLKHLDLETGILLASDKDDYTAFNTRILPLCAVLRDQIENYLRHRRVVLAKLSLLDRKLAQKIEANRYGTGVFFLLDRDPKSNLLRPNPVSPTRLMAFIGQHVPTYRLPSNSQRARLRSRLLELDCPPQWIDAFLGHWSRGEEPWHRYATTAMRRICDGIRQYLDRISREDGWQSIRGLA